MWPNCVGAEKLIYDPLCGSEFILYPKHVAILWVSVLKGYQARSHGGARGGG